MPHGKTWFAVCWHDAADLNEYVKSMCRYSHVPALLSTVEDSDHRNTCGVDASQRLPQCLLHAPCMGAGTVEARDPSVPFPWIAYVWPLRGRMQRMQSVCRSQMNTRKKQDGGLLCCPQIESSHLTRCDGRSTRAVHPPHWQPRDRRRVVASLHCTWLGRNDAVDPAIFSRTRARNVWRRVEFLISRDEERQ